MIRITNDCFFQLLIKFNGHIYMKINIQSSGLIKLHNSVLPINKIVQGPTN